ncbi:MAG: UbiA family prenyltransferase [Planctomycetota bacterium]
MNSLLEIIKISRPGFYPTQAWFYSLPFAQRDVFDQPEFWLGLFYVTFPLGLLLYGWNDISDSETDAANSRKGTWLFGGRPDARLRRQLPWIIALVQIPFAILFSWIAGPKMLIWLAAVVGSNALYNNVGWKQLPVLDVLNQSGYLLVFVLASWLCEVPMPGWPTIVFGALFAMQSHLFSEIMDIDVDKLSGRHTSAMLLGAYASKRVLGAIMIVESAIAFIYFPGPWVGGFMALGATFFLVDSWVGPKRYSLTFVTLFFVGWNMVVFGSIYFVWRFGLLAS